MPKVSVLMPIWNTQEAHLREAIESILNQTFKDFEFLILNDSPNNTLLDEIVASYNDSRIRYTRNEINMGITPSRNKLLQMAKGEYIAIFDHDDISLPERLEKQTAYLDKHPDVGVVGSWARYTNGKTITYPEKDISIKELLMDVCPVLHPAAMLRKSVLNKHNLRYEDEYSPSEDYCLWLRLIEYTKFANIPEVLFHYRIHANNTSITQKERMALATKRLQIWAQKKYPHLWESYYSEKPFAYQVKLFGFIPFISIRKINTRKIQVKLFGILILTLRKKNGRHPQVKRLLDD